MNRLWQVLDWLVEKIGGWLRRRERE